jgi:GNAT superfamily N-acetyltransferase
VTGDMAELELRPATNADRRFCFALHEATMREYVTAIWGWDDAVQREFFNRGWDPSITRIVMRHGQNVGILKLEEQLEVTYIGLLEIHPDHQGRGIGGLLIREIGAVGGWSSTCSPSTPVRRRCIAGWGSPSSTGTATATSGSGCVGGGIHRSSHDGSARLPAWRVTSTRTWRSSRPRCVSCS